MTKLTLGILSFILASAILFTSCSNGKYCVGGKKKYKRMKNDHGNMVF
jgi:hypothetical protein